jgi:glycosyltransferase involved in cell wall biosynthesis
MQRLAPILPQNCIKIFLIDVAHNLFNSCAELNRLIALQKRRRVTLRPRRFEMPNLAIEHADCAIMIGNQWTESTFSYINKQIYHLPNSSMLTFSWTEEKEIDACRKSFLWLGSFGLVHKGLDLVLEAFAEMPDYHLTICGPIKREPDFEQAFYKELYQTPNIHTIGWIDISSTEFKDILKSCIGGVYASCSEGQSGSVITYLHAGLIPIISRECGVNIGDFGVCLSDCSIEEIKASVRWVANQPAQTLKQMTRKAWEYARANHTKEKFTEEYQSIVEQIIRTYQK